MIFFPDSCFVSVRRVYGGCLCVCLWQWAGRPQLRPRSRRWLLLLQLALPPVWWNKVAFLRGVSFSLLSLFTFLLLFLWCYRDHISAWSLKHVLITAVFLLTPALWTVACGWAVGMACSYFCYTSSICLSLPVLLPVLSSLLYLYFHVFLCCCFMFVFTCDSWQSTFIDSFLI